MKSSPDVKPAGSVTISLYFDRALHLKLKALARRGETSVSALIRRLARVRVEQHEAAQARRAAKALKQG